MHVLITSRIFDPASCIHDQVRCNTLSVSNGGKEANIKRIWC